MILAGYLIVKSRGSSTKVFSNKANDQSNLFNEEIERFFSWTCLNRIMAWVCHHKQNLSMQSQHGKAKEVIGYQSDVSKTTQWGFSKSKKKKRKQSLKEELLASCWVSWVCKRVEETAQSNLFRAFSQFGRSMKNGTQEHRGEARRRKERECL